MTQMLRNDRIDSSVRRGIAEGIKAAQPSADVIRELIQLRSHPQINRDVSNEIDHTLIILNNAPTTSTWGGSPIEEPSS
jgi:hypothetical protein